MDTRGCAFETYWEQLKPNYKAHVDEFLWEQLRKYPAKAIVSDRAISVDESKEGPKKAVEETKNVSISPEISDGFTAFLLKFQLNDTQQFLFKVLPSLFPACYPFTFIIFMSIL